MAFTVRQAMALVLLRRALAADCILPAIQCALMFVDEPDYVVLSAVYSLLQAMKLERWMGQHNLDENLPNLAPQFLHRTAQFLQEHRRYRFAFLEDWSRNRQVSGVDLAIPEVNHLISVLPPELAQVKQGFEATLITLIELQQDWRAYCYGTMRREKVSAAFSQAVRVCVSWGHC